MVLKGSLFLSILPLYLASYGTARVLLQHRTTPAKQTEPVSAAGGIPVSSYVPEAPHFETSAAESKARALCGKNKTVCGVSGGRKEFACVDTTSNLKCCGGCTVLSPFATPDQPSQRGVDCSTIEGASTVACLNSRCVVEECIPGFSVSSSGDSCAKDIKHDSMQLNSTVPSADSPTVADGSMRSGIDTGSSWEKALSVANATHVGINKAQVPSAGSAPLAESPFSPSYRILVAPVKHISSHVSLVNEINVDNASSPADHPSTQSTQHTPENIQYNPQFPHVQGRDAVVRENVPALSSNTFAATRTVIDVNSLDKASCKGANAIIAVGAVQILDYTGSETLSSLATESEAEKVKQYTQASAKGDEDGMYHASGHRNDTESGDAPSRGPSSSFERFSTASDSHSSASSASAGPAPDLNSIFSLGSTDAIVSDQLNTGLSSSTSNTQDNGLPTGSPGLSLSQLADNWAAQPAPGSVGTEPVNENANAAADEGKGNTYASSVSDSVAGFSSNWSNGSESSSASKSGTGTGSRNNPLQQPCTDVGGPPDALAKPEFESATTTEGKGALSPERVPASTSSTFVVSASSASSVQSGEGPLDVTTVAASKVNLDGSENDVPEGAGLSLGSDSTSILRNDNCSNESDDDGSGDDALSQKGVVATESQLKLGASSAAQEVRKHDEKVDEGVHQDGEHVNEGVKESESAKVDVIAEVKAEDTTSKADTTLSTLSGSTTPSSTVGTKTSKDLVDCNCTDADLLGGLLGSGSGGPPNVDEQVHAGEQKDKDHIPDGLNGPASSSSPPTSITNSGNVNSGTTFNSGAQAAEWTQKGGDSDHSNPPKANSMLGLDDEQNKVVTADADVKAAASVDADSTGQSQGQWPDAIAASNDSAKNSGVIQIESTLSLNADAQAHADVEDHSSR